MPRTKKASAAKSGSAKSVVVKKTETTPELHLRGVPGSAKAHLGGGKKISILSAPTYNLTGKNLGTTLLPKEVFGQKVNKQLIAQAVRVYQTNISTHKAHTKTRGKVRGGGAKPWRQKGTGRARAGSSRSPIWVGGGKVFGPRFKDVKLSMSSKMKQAALLSALSAKASSGEIKIISGLEKAQLKTKIIASLISKIGINGRTLFVVPQKNENLKLATRNLQKVNLEIATNLNALSVITNQNILFSKEALEIFK